MRRFRGRNSSLTKESFLTMTSAAALIATAVIHLLWIGLVGTDTILTIPLGEGIEISSLWLATAISLASAVAIFRTV